jgi:uncharacterized repeat protein (TIGR01451 family)
LTTVPGLGSATYGQNAAYIATITNTGGAALKNVRLHFPIPNTIVDGQPQQAIFQSSSCTGALTATEWLCNTVSKLAKGKSLAVTVAWQTPAGGSSANCPGDDSCLAASAFWTVKTTAYPMGPVATTLLSGDDPSSAATYALAACSDPSSPTVATDPNVGPDNPLATSVCAPNLPVNDPLHPGLVTAVEELDTEEGDPGFAPEKSDICIPAPGFECGQTPFVFSPLATFTFVLDNDSLPAEIKKVFHDGVLVSERLRDDPHVVSIKRENFKGITTIVVESSTNGKWGFG